MMTIPKSDQPHPLQQPAMKSFVTTITILRLSTSTCSECSRAIKKTRPATCTTCGQSRHLACTYLLTCERECIQDGCREWRWCGTEQSPSKNTIPCLHQYTTSKILENTMLKNEPVVHPKIQEVRGTTKQILQNPFLN